MDWLVWATVAVVVLLFLVLFLQNTFIRYRLQDLQQQALNGGGSSSSEGGPGYGGRSEEGLDNAMRAYVVQVDCPLTVALSGSSVQPSLELPCPTVTSGSLRPTMQPAQTFMRGKYIVLADTPGGRHLYTDVERGAVRFLAMGNVVVRAGVVQLSGVLAATDMERLQEKQARVIVLAPVRFGSSECNPATTTPAMDPVSLLQTSFVSNSDVLADRVNRILGCSSAGAAAAKNLLLFGFGSGIPAGVVRRGGL